MDLFRHISTDTLLLTPNRRLSAYYLKQYQQQQLQQGKLSWKTLDSLPLSSWLTRTYNEYTQFDNTQAFILIKPDQELIAWEEIITHSVHSQHLLQVSATAELAKSAWGLLKQWRIDLSHPSLKLTEDSNTFLQWAVQFQEECAKQRWIDQNSLPDFISEKIKINQIKVPSHILFAGFTEISPQIKQLIQACENNGSHVDYYLQKNRNQSISRISLADTDTEIRTMARWAKATYEKEPATIACIISNLEDMREKVTRIFTEVFTEKTHYTLDTLSLPFNITAGKNLASYSIIHTALQLLELHTSHISIDILSNILRSPFIGDAEKEMLRRADFSNQLHRDNIQSITLHELLKQKYKPELLANRLKLALEFIQKSKAKLTFSAWIKVFCEYLSLLGWPGERSVNSEEYQIIQRWMNLLSECTTYDTTLGTINDKTAVHYLKRITTLTVFQPQSPETPIQILGVLEAAEIPFDYMWAMGMDDSTWPPSPKPNPFIPQHLQKKLLMPHATAERELQFCEKITTQLKNCANTLIFSHALHDDEFEVRASALIESIPEMTLDQLTLSQSHETATFIFSHQALEQLSDDKASDILPTESVKGGAKIFELQAACPFKAFAELRLNAKPIEPPSHGLRAVDRGNITHKALELIWLELKNSETLIRLSDEDLQAVIHTAIKKALDEVTDEQSNYLDLEKQRLQKIINAWLDIEKQRPPFEVIAQEQKYEITIANISITLRVDRIDEIKTNEKLIIDYKTGNKNQIQDWFGSRPEAPQLPLYCILDPEHTVGIAFAVINPEKMGLKGVSKDNLNIRSIETLVETKASDKNFWEEQSHFWRQTLENLGNRFYHGHAEIDPKDGLKTCEYCQIKPLCRIYEKQAL